MFLALHKQILEPELVARPHQLQGEAVRVLNGRQVQVVRVDPLQEDLAQLGAQVRPI